MPRRFISIDEINADAVDPAKHTAADPALNLNGWEITTCGRMLAALPDRCIRYVFSDASVGRDMHTIAADAWDLTNFTKNPVFLWAHMDDELPVGRVEDLTTERGQLVGLVRYAEHDFAETVYQMVKGSFLNATSTGWLPLEWRAANDRKRPGGLDFTRVELLEISQVPVPALPTALVSARKAGVNTRPLYDWAERLLAQGDFAVIGKADLESLRKAARMPKAARKPEPAPEAPAGSAEAAPTRFLPPSSLQRSLRQRDLGGVADFAYYLMSIEYLYDRVAAEAVREDDGSEVPAKLRAWIDDGNRLLLEMCGEETAEQIAGTQDDGPSYDWRGADLGTAIARALDDLGVTRAGKKYSAETVRCLREIADHTGAAHEALSRMLDDAAPEAQASEPEPDDEAKARAVEERRARASALKARVAG